MTHPFSVEKMKFKFFQFSWRMKAYIDNLISGEAVLLLYKTSQRFWSFQTTSMTSLILVTFVRTNVEHLFLVKYFQEGYWQTFF